MAGSLLLIVVGRPEHRRRFNRCFSSSEHRLVYTFDGEDAFDRFVEVRPDLVIAYEHAPRLDGTLLCQLLRQQGGAHLPFVLLADEPVAEERLLATGADAVLIWPFEPPEVTPIIEDLLKRAALRAGTFPPRALVADTTDLEGAETTSLDLEGSTLSAVFLDDDAEPARPLEDAVDEFPTNPGEAPMLIGDLLEEPLAPTGIREFLPDEVTNVQLQSELFDLFDESAPTGPDSAEDPAELPLVSPVLDDALETDARASAPPLGGPDDLSTTTTDTAKKRMLLEEPPLPGPGDLREFSTFEDSAPRSRPTTDSMIREIPRDATPTGERSSAPVERPEGRVGRGLDESQLGRRLTRRVEQLHKLMGELDHYQVLGLEPDATKEAIDSTYFDLSIEFHPDRFFLLRSGPLKQQIFEIYHRLSVAYGVLSETVRRSEYDRSRAPSVPAEGHVSLVSVSAPAPTPPWVEAQTDEEELLSRTVFSASPTGQILIDLARSSLEDADRNGARLYLTIALTAEPDNLAVRDLLATVVAQGAGLRPLPPVP